MAKERLNDLYYLVSILSCSFILLNSEKARIEGKNILVHCIQGISRSVSIVLAYLMYKGRTLKESYDLVREKRSVSRPNPSFVKELLAYELTLFKSNSCDGNYINPLYKFVVNDSWKEIKNRVCVNMCVCGVELLMLFVSLQGLPAKYYDKNDELGSEIERRKSEGFNRRKYHIIIIS